jgi:hypothetical protein
MDSPFYFLKCRTGKSRWLLIIIPLGIIPLIFVETLQTYIYVSCYTLLSSVIFLYNCPYFIQCIHIKPVYFEDLQVDEKIDPLVKTKFQDVFTRVLNILLAMALTILVNYTLYKMKDSPLSVFELFGMLGGIISLYKTIWDYLGKILLKILIIKKENHQSVKVKQLGKYNNNNNENSSNTNSSPIVKISSPSNTLIDFDPLEGFTRQKLDSYDENNSNRTRSKSQLSLLSTNLSPSLRPIIKYMDDHNSPT